MRHPGNAGSGIANELMRRMRFGKESTALARDQRREDTSKTLRKI